MIVAHGGVSLCQERHLSARLATGAFGVGNEHSSLCVVIIPHRKYTLCLVWSALCFWWGGGLPGTTTDLTPKFPLLFGGKFSY